MKKSTKILLNVCIILIFIACIVSLALSINTLVNSINNKAAVQEQLNSRLPVQDYIHDFIIENSGFGSQILNEYNMYVSEINTYKAQIIQSSVIISLTVVASAASVFVFVYCNPKLFRRSVYDKFAEGWAQNKAERAEQKKQARIAKLQSELDELKKDE